MSKLSQTCLSLPCITVLWVLCVSLLCTSPACFCSTPAMHQPHQPCLLPVCFPGQSSPYIYFPSPELLHLPLIPLSDQFYLSPAYFSMQSLPGKLSALFVFVMLLLFTIKSLVCRAICDCIHSSYYKVVQNFSSSVSPQSSISVWSQYN